MLSLLTKNSLFATNRIYLFQHSGRNLLGNQIEMTLILFFLNENKVFKIETPEIIEIENQKLKEVLRELQTTTFSEDEESIGTYNIQNNFITIKFKHIEMEGLFPSTVMNLNIHVRYVDYLQAKVIKQQVLENARFLLIES